MLVAVHRDMQAVKFQQHPSVFNWGCQVMQVVLYNGCRMAILVKTMVILVKIENREIGEHKMFEDV